MLGLGIPALGRNGPPVWRRSPVTASLVELARWAWLLRGLLQLGSRTPAAGFTLYRRLRYTLPRLGPADPAPILRTVGLAVPQVLLGHRVRLLLADLALALGTIGLAAPRVLRLGWVQLLLADLLAIAGIPGAAVVPIHRRRWPIRAGLGCRLF